MSNVPAPDGFRSDSDLLELASKMLTDEDFVVAHVGDDASEFLLAENRFFIIALATPATLRDLLAAEPAVESYLRGRLELADVGPKVWDAYLVLLTQERALDEGAGLHPLFNINYDTRGLRRMAQAGVSATAAGVRDALAPFMRPLMIASAGLSEDPLQAFESALVEEGVPPQTALRSVEIFKQGGRLDDAV